LRNGINLVYGENESGKSTLLDFFSSIFYGANKNKNGKEMSNFDKYTPWEEGEYSGKISYELDNGKEFEVYRNFAKKSPKIFDKNANDISKEFTIDKAEGNKFFYEQTKVDEQLFNMSMVIHQQEVKLDSKSQNILVQKASNIMLTGEDNVSYQKVFRKIK
jgi:exonuclease SbcC